MRTRLVASVVVVLVGGIWLTCVSAGAPATPARWTEDSGLSEPKVVEKVNPVYPDEAKAERVQGVVVLDVTVDTAGVVSDAKVLEDPDPRLSQAAVDAVRQWRFEPARSAKGEAVAVVYTVTVKFMLK